jgi:hypothetical protein
VSSSGRALRAALPGVVVYDQAETSNCSPSVTPDISDSQALRAFVHTVACFVAGLWEQLAQRFRRPRNSSVGGKPAAKHNQVHIQSINRQVVWPLVVVRQELAEIQRLRKQKSRP